MLTTPSANNQQFASRAASTCLFGHAPPPKNPPTCLFLSINTNAGQGLPPGSLWCELSHLSFAPRCSEPFPNRVIRGGFVASNDPLASLPCQVRGGRAVDRDSRVQDRPMHQPWLVRSPISRPTVVQRCLEAAGGESSRSAAAAGKFRADCDSANCAGEALGRGAGSP